MRFLCLACSEWSTKEEADAAFAAGRPGCPKCGDTGVPSASDDEVTVKITWHELRVLVMWAENWAHSNKKETPKMPRVVYGIADRLALQHLDKAAPLTMRGEIAALREAFGPQNVQTNMPHEDDTKEP